MGPFLSWLLEGTWLKDFLSQFIHDHGVWTYLLLFAVIFCETGLVITPILPGDSLLFLVGTFASDPHFNLNPILLLTVLSIAAILGDTANYWLGHYIGPKAFTENRRYLKKEYLERTHRFYEKYGGKTIILARFVPIVRTFAPFVAGIGAMNYPKFIVYNIVGGIAWVACFLFAGYWFGKLPWIENRMKFVIIAIILISVMPMAFEYWRARREAKKEKAEGVREKAEE